PANLTSPVAGCQYRFGGLALDQPDASRGKISGDGASRNQRYDVHELPVAEISENFFHHAAVHHHSMHWQRIHEFIGKEAPRRDARRNFRRTRELPVSRMAL